MGVVWDRKLYDEAYQLQVRDPNHPRAGEVVGYGRLFAQMFRDPETPEFTEYQHRASLLEPFIDPGERTLVVGCGFGFLMDELNALGRPSIGVDSSEWIMRNWRRERGEPHPFGPMPLLADVRDPVIERVGPFDVVVTEAVLESYPDGAELTEVIARCHELASKVIHMIHDGSEPFEPLVTKSFEQWCLDDPEAIWVSLTTGATHA